MKLKLGMRVKIKNDFENYQTSAGTVKIITEELPSFDGKRAFEVDNFHNAIWLIEDFECCIDYPSERLE